MEDIFRAYQPTGPIELKVVIKWEFRSDNPDEQVTKAADDADLASKVNAAADFSGIIAKVVAETKKEFDKNGGGRLQEVIQTVLESETERAVRDAQKEFYRVLGLTEAKVVWQDVKTIGTAIWKVVSATVTTIGIATTIAAGGPVGLAASLIYYCSNGMQALKGFTDTYHSLKNSFGDIGSNIDSCKSSMNILEAQWNQSREYANVQEASSRILQAVFPESIVASTNSLSDKLEQIGTACDRIEIQSRKLSPQLNEALQNLSTAQDILEDFEEALKDFDSHLVDGWLREVRSNFTSLTNAFEQTFDTIAEVNGKVLRHRKRIRKMSDMLEAFKGKEMVWLRLWSMAWEHYVDFVNDLTGDLAPKPVGETWTKMHEVCEQVDKFQKTVDKAVAIKDNVKELYETAQGE